VGDTPAEAAAAPETPRPAGGIDTAAIRRAWPDILAWIFKHKRTTWTLLSEHATVHDFDGSKVVLAISTVGIANTFRHGPHADLVRQALIDVLGVEARVEGIPTPESSRSSAPMPQAASPQSDSTGDQDDPEAPSAAADRAPSTTPTVVRTPESGADGWAAAPSSPDSGPSWAGPVDSEQAVAQTSSRLQRARAEVAAESPAGTVRTHVADDSAASADDEDIVALGEVGRPVIERLLGGRVIDEGQ
jgi:DNA polymerase-3 subunit gamma/tau